MNFFLELANELLEVSTSTKYPPGKFIFHYVFDYEGSDLEQVRESVKKHGIGSPKYMYDHDRELFHSKSFEVYKNRAADFIKKDVSQVTDEDVIRYLDHDPKRQPMNASTIFFTFLSESMHHPDIYEHLKHSVKIVVETAPLLGYKPLIILGGKISTSNWKYITSTTFLSSVKRKSLLGTGRFVFSRVPHLALNCYHIPIEDIKSIEII